MGLTITQMPNLLHGAEFNLMAIKLFPDIECMSAEHRSKERFDIQSSHKAKDRISKLDLQL